MSLKETIAVDLQSAMKAGDRTRLETLRTLRAALMEKEIELRGKGARPTDQDELAVLAQAAKKRKESIELFRQGNRQDLVDQEQSELLIIEEYLPRMMNAEEIQKVVSDIITRSGLGDGASFSKVMPLAMKELKGRADGKLVQDIVRKSLGPT